MLDQVGHEHRQSIVLAMRPAVFDRGVAALDVAVFAQTFLKSRQKSREWCGRSAMQKPDHRRSRLLCARGGRPRHCRATERRDELAPGKER